MPTIGIDVHKNASTVAVVSDDPTEDDPIEKRRVKNEELAEVAKRYAGSDAVLEATSNYYTIYDRLAEHVDPTVSVLTEPASV